MTQIRGWRFKNEKRTPIVNNCVRRHWFHVIGGVGGACGGVEHGVESWSFENDI